MKTDNEVQLKSEQVKEALRARSDPSLIDGLKRYFKSGPGQYGEGDQFIGVRVPQSRLVAKQFSELPLTEIDKLLKSLIHEERQVGLFILVKQFSASSLVRRNDAKRREEILLFYLKALKRGEINNWDLIDCSAEQILGRFLLDRPRRLLIELSRSSSIWERRASIVATFAFIKNKDPSTTFEIGKILIDDREPLIHKAVGWMIRETGKRVDRQQLIQFLRENAARMPRTMLSYAIEHFSAEEKSFFRNLRN